jgi:hypothetical protein
MPSHPAVLVVAGVIVLVVILAVLLAIPFPGTQTHHFCASDTLSGSAPATIGGTTNYSVPQTVQFGWTTAPLHAITMEVLQGGSVVYSAYGQDGTGSFDSSAGVASYAFNATSPPNDMTVFINGTYVVHGAAPLVAITGAPPCT